MTTDSTNTDEATRRDASALEREVMQHECPHDQGIQTWRMGDGRGAGLWSCLACARKFVPLDVAMEQDARRYRWLREQHWSSSPLCAVADPKEAVKLGRTCPSREYLDMAIDDAMAGVVHAPGAA